MKLAKLFPVTIMAAAVCGMGGSAWYHHRCGLELALASSQLDDCRAMASKIAQLQAAPQKASLSGQSLTALTAMIEEAAVQATINASDIVRIDPQALRRVGNTEYKEQATEVELRSATLGQLARFVANIHTRNPDLKIHTLRLRVPHDGAESSPETWLAEAVLTQRIYAPKSATEKTR